MQVHVPREVYFTASQHSPMPLSETILFVTLTLMLHVKNSEFPFILISISVYKIFDKTKYKKDTKVK